MSGWLSSDEPWVAHDRDFWNRALELAKSKGWYFKYSGKAHVFAWISCKPGRYHPPGEACGEVIYKTGEGNPRSVALDTEKAIRACKHNERKSGPDLPERAEAEALLREAEILLAAADRVLTAGGDLSDAQMLFEQALAAEGEAIDEFERQAVDAEQRSERNENLARADISRVDVELPLDAETLIAAAEQRLQVADAFAELQSAIRQARQRIASLRTRMDAIR